MFHPARDRRGDPPAELPIGTPPPRSRRSAGRPDVPTGCDLDMNKRGRPSESTSTDESDMWPCTFMRIPILTGTVGHGWSLGVPWDGNRRRPMHGRGMPSRRAGMARRSSRGTGWSDTGHALAVVGSRRTGTGPRALHARPARPGRSLSPPERLCYPARSSGGGRLPVPVESMSSTARGEPSAETCVSTR